uniref:F-box only protein 36a n=1 Tax=Semicossyphus pulcher TaxID=241346 RepID=UPI0037E6F9E4
MASLLGEQLFQISGQGPPPPKDFFQLVISKNEVILRSWKISVRLESRGAAPKEIKKSHHDFLHNKMLHQQVGAAFGQRILEHAVSLCQGKFDYLERLPDDLLLRILSYLELKDTTLLAQASHRFRKLCNSENFWEQTVRNRCAEFTSDMEAIANVMGWRKMFFTLFHPSSSKECDAAGVTQQWQHSRNREPLPEPESTGNFQTAVKREDECECFENEDEAYSALYCGLCLPADQRLYRPQLRLLSIRGL